MAFYVHYSSEKCLIWWSHFSCTFSYRSQTSNGIAASESGQLVQPKSADESAAYITQGEFTYTGPDGNQYTVRYTADQYGFHPEGAHLPRA